MTEAAWKLLSIKIIHTAIWIFYVVVIGYIVYCALVGEFGLTVWIAVGLVVVEGIVLAINRWRCPLTVIGSRYTDSTEDNFDIFLPRWLARNNKVIFTSIFGIALLILLYRIATGE